MDLLPTGLALGDQCEVQHQSNFLLRGLFLTYSFFFVNGFCVPFFVCLPLLFLSLCSAPPHSSSTNPKFWYQKEQHIMDFIPLKCFWVPVWGRETKKKNFMFFDGGLCFFSIAHTISHSTPKGSRILKYADIESDKFSELIKKNSGSLRGATGKIFPLFFVHLWSPSFTPYTPSY